jgi:nucleotide-binding universal stress UspA family protein
VEILPMLARLEHALGCSDLSRQMVLKPNPFMPSRSHGGDINLVVGYTDSPQSHTALDLTLWIAYQTRLATRKTVTVQVVYVVDPDQSGYRQPRSIDAVLQAEMDDRKVPLYQCGNTLEPISLITGATAPELSTKAVALEVAERHDRSIERDTNWQIHQFEQADRILWQARNLANEWRGSLETHLRFGSVATELRDVARKEAATVLVVGCESANHPIVEALGDDLPCPVLGIPPRVCRA